MAFPAATLLPRRLYLAMRLCARVRLHLRGTHRPLCRRHSPHPARVRVCGLVGQERGSESSMDAQRPLMDALTEEENKDPDVYAPPLRPLHQHQEQPRRLPQDPRPCHKQRGCYFQAGRALKLGTTIDAAFRMALQTWASWVEKRVDLNQTHVFFRTSEPSHWRQGSPTSLDRSGLKRGDFLWLMRDHLVNVTEESRDASEEAKCVTVEAMSESSVFIKLKKPAAAICDVNAVLEVRRPHPKMRVCMRGDAWHVCGCICCLLLLLSCSTPPSSLSASCYGGSAEYLLLGHHLSFVPQRDDSGSVVVAVPPSILIWKSPRSAGGGHGSSSSRQRDFTPIFSIHRARPASASPLSKLPPSLVLLLASFYSVELKTTFKFRTRITLQEQRRLVHGRHRRVTCGTTCQSCRARRGHHRFVPQPRGDADSPHKPCVITSAATLSCSTPRRGARVRLAPAPKNAGAPLRLRPALLLQLELQEEDGHQPVISLYTCTSRDESLKKRSF